MILQEHMMSIFKVAVPVRRVLCLLGVLWLVGCSPSHPLERYVLIAPFEGEEREVGYQVLYGARLAIQQANRLDIELLAVDDGGSPEQLQQRLYALARDPAVQHIMIAGSNSADLSLGTSQYRIGQWKVDPDSPCGDKCTLLFFRAQLESGEAIIVETTSPPINPDFRTVYLTSDQFVPEPLPLALASYQTVQALMNGQPIPNATYRYQVTVETIQFD